MELRIEIERDDALVNPILWTVSRKGHSVASAAPTIDDAINSINREIKSEWNFQ